ncbi:hypothetical protein [Plantactinospora sonchi]|uniref:Uncharacterized protein n=1 Tax=Plantactinospora sonchi TaxID=1544735 RepID=A0ABU7RS04_9ACTN
MGLGSTDWLSRSPRRAGKVDVASRAVAVVTGRNIAIPTLATYWARARHGWRVTVAADIRTGLTSTDLIITVTPATEPLVRVDRLPDGVHVTAVGSDAPHKRELGLDVIARADRIAVDDHTQACRLGELKHLDDATLASLPVVTLGAVLAGTAPGRTSDTDVTIADLTGLGIQDTALANVVVRRLEGCRLHG